MRVSVIGAGLAGCEAAYQLALAGIETDLYEMKPEKYSPAHKYPGFAELVCSNSLKANGLDNACGLLKEEMRRLGSVTMQAAAESRVEAGGALAVDRGLFSDKVTALVRALPGVRVIEGKEVSVLPDGPVIVATGPLTSDALAEELVRLTGSEGLHFFDAAAPIISAESVDTDKAFLASRWGKGEAAYLNCPMERDEYDAFYDALITAETAELHEFDKGGQVFEGCIPVEVMAKRGRETLLYGPLRPVGLTDPRTGHRPFAVVQLRREDAEGTRLNLVGFQTHLKFGEQKRVFSMIPGLEHAEFLRYGVMHRNTYIETPKRLDAFCRLKQDDRIWFAGQMTGVEGYVESAASGLAAGLNLARVLKGLEPIIFSELTAHGALFRAVTTTANYGKEGFQPMNINFGLIPPLEYRVRNKRERYAAISERALAALTPSVEQAENGRKLPL